MTLSNVVIEPMTDEFILKLGFRLVSTERAPAFQQENDFVRKARQQATALGLDPEAIKSKYTMRIELTYRGRS